MRYFKNKLGYFNSPEVNEEGMKQVKRFEEEIFKLEGDKELAEAFRKEVQKSFSEKVLYYVLLDNYDQLWMMFKDGREERLESLGAVYQDFVEEGTWVEMEEAPW